jgi:hypothetical protein
MERTTTLRLSAAVVAALGFGGSTAPGTPAATAPAVDAVAAHAVAAIQRGRATFRHDTFGSEAYFSDVLRLDDVFAGVSPRDALGLGVKVDVERLSGPIRRALRSGQVDLDDPAVTRLLFQRGAVVGVRAEVTAQGGLQNLGITCAFCHSTVDDSLAPGVGRRLDGWANRDLDVGAILALSPNLQPLADLLGVDVPTVRTVLNGWGPGKFDAHLNLDGKALRPDGQPAAVLIPPAFGLAGINLHTYEGWGSVPYWNAFVASNEMNGSGRFFDPRLADAGKYPLAAAQGLDDVREQPDRVTPQLADLQLFQLALTAPPPRAGSFDRAAARRGEVLFAGKAGCADCHVPPLFTEPGWSLHTPEEIGVDSFQADRGPHGRYRTTPLRGLWTHTRGGFYHDGRFPTLLAVVDHYDQHLDLGLSAAEKGELVEYLKSL